LLLDPALQETFLRLREEHAVLTLVKLEDTITRDLTVLTKVFGDALKGLKENGQPELFEKTTAILAFHKNVSKLLSADNSFKGDQVGDPRTAFFFFFCSSSYIDIAGIPLVLEHYNTHQVIFFDYLHVFDKVARELNEWRQSKAVQKVFEDRQLTKAAELNFLRLMWKPMPNIYAFYNHTLRLMDLVAEDNENMLLLKKVQPLFSAPSISLCLIPRCVRSKDSTRAPNSQAPPLGCRPRRQTMTCACPSGSTWTTRSCRPRSTAGRARPLSSARQPSRRRARWDRSSCSTACASPKSPKVIIAVVFVFIFICGVCVRSQLLPV